MDLTYYKQILNIFPDKPALRSLKNGTKVPECWPLILKAVQKKTDNTLVFEVADLETSIVCKTKDPDMVLKLLAVEIGQVIFLYDAVARNNRRTGLLEIDIKAIYTLKEVNDGFIKPSSPVKSKSTAVKTNKTTDLATSNEPVQDFKWRTLAERWQKQGKFET